MRASVKSDCTAVDFSPETIFISYSRSDGRAFAEAFERRLVDEAGIKSWRDLKSVEGGEDIRSQVLRAIESVKHLVLILSPRALASDWVKREWTHARMVGRKVSPVLSDPTIKRSDLPGWIRRADVYDISEPERWTMLVQVLRGSGETRRVPYMAGDRPDDFVPRPTEFAALKDAVLSTRRGAAVGVTTALRGAGGYGKTTLANELCRDPEVRFEFTDGILRVEIGKERDDVTGLVVDLIEKLDPEARRPGFQDVVTASEHLGELIGEARLLLVIDDVWREAQLRPFLRGGPNCVRLVTTRVPQVLPRSAKPIAIDEMRAAEAVRLISANLPVAGNQVAQRLVARLSERLGYWAQMLSIANGWIRNRVGQGEALETAVARFEQRLEKRGLTAFDSRDEKDRNRAIRACVEASLEDLKPDELARFCELAILPEDEDVPFGVVAALWAETGDLDQDQSEDLVQRLYALSLLQSFDLSAWTLRLHDIMIWYLRDRMGTEGCPAAHAAMVRAIGTACKSRWPKLPTQHAYGWRFLIRHLRGAGQETEADRLLVDYAWIKAKLGASGPRDLYESYLPESTDEGARLIGRAIALSLPALAANPCELPRQLFGRLGKVDCDPAAAIVVAAKKDKNFSPAPRWPGLTPPGAERLRLVGHVGPVTSAAFSPDGTRIMTTSWDETARLWDATTGAAIAILRGHKDSLDSAAFSPDNAYIVTASWDKTARLWDTVTGAEIAILRGHQDQVTSANFSPDGARIITASWDETARLWDALTGTEIAVLRCHKEHVTSANFSPDGARIITASWDKTARLWDAATGADIAVLRGHEGYVTCAAFSPNGAQIVTASVDNTARLWDAAAGAEIAILRGHEGSVRSAAFSPDAGRIVTASDDETARLWDAAAGAEIAILRGHESSVKSAAFSPDNNRVITASDDQTARFWDASTGAEIAAPLGHKDKENGPAFSPDGDQFVTTSQDQTKLFWEAATRSVIADPNGPRSVVTGAAFSFRFDEFRIVTGYPPREDSTAQLWDAATGAEIAARPGHESSVTSLAFSPGGALIITHSEDQTVRLWDAATGAEIAKDKQVTVAYSPDGTRILADSGVGTVRLWDAATGAEIAILRGREDRLTSVTFSPDGSRIVTKSDDHTVRLWDAATGTEIAGLRRHEDGSGSVDFSPDRARIVTTGAWWAEVQPSAAAAAGTPITAPHGRDAYTVRLWDAATGAEIAILRGPEDKEIKVVFSPDGARIVTTSDDETARLWDAATGAEIAILRGHDDGVKSAAFSPDGTRIVTASREGTARLWDAATGAEIAILRGYKVSRVLAFSPDGTRFITGSDDHNDHTARLWDAATGAEIAILDAYMSPGEIGWAFSPDGTRIVTDCANGTGLWDAATGAEVAVLRCAFPVPPRRQPQYEVAFSPDGYRIVMTERRTGAAGLWDAVAGAEISTLRRHEDRVKGTTFSADGSRIVTTTFDHTARLWDTESGAEIATLNSYGSFVYSAAFFPDGSHLVTASSDRTTHLWNAATGTEGARIVLDAQVTAIAIRDGTIALGDAFGRIHIFDLAGGAGQ